MDKNGVRRYFSWRISREDFVAEIGSGHDPYWRSDLLIDKFVSDSTERPSGTAPLFRDRALVIGDAIRLPLRDKSVDFLIARNVVEHIPEVETFLAEMMRVSRRGYITSPSRLAEKLFGWDIHIWFVSSEDGRLILRAKGQPIFDPELSSVFHGLFAKDRSFDQFYRRNRSLFVMEHLWRDTIAFQLFPAGLPAAAIKTSQAAVESDLGELETALASTRRSGGLRQNAERLLRKAMSKHNLTSGIAAIDRLACPHCGESFGPASDMTRLTCSRCGQSYPVIGGVPVLITEVADLA